MVDGLTHAAGLFHLNELAVLDIVGEDAQVFLQAQLTSDTKALAIKSAQYTAYCSPKGRMLANGYLARIAETHYQWIMDKSVMDRLLKRLSMFILRSKVKLQPSGARCFGMLPGQITAYDELFFKAPSDNTIPASPAPLQVITVTSDCTTLLLPGDRTLMVNQAASSAEHAPERAPIDWDLTSIAADEVLVKEATCEELIPQMIEWDRLGGVSFKKGCYPGQEIVARSHYLGKMKRRLFRATFSGNAPAVGEAIVDAAHPEQSMGVIVRTASTSEGGAALAVLSTDLFKENAVLQVANEAQTALKNWVARFPSSPETAKLNP